MNPFERSAMLMGEESLERLRRSRVAVFGVGGVGGYVVEVLARSGVGSLDLIDNDTVSVTNLNRQIFALHSTLGQRKVDVAKGRILDINPACTVRTHALFYLPSNADGMDLGVYDYVVDCIDTVCAKLELVKRCTSLGVPLICSMGAANKMDPTGFRVEDLSKTNTDPLARVMRRELKKVGILHLKCVYSEEAALTPRGAGGESDLDEAPGGAGKRRVPASNAFVPAAAGLVVASAVVKDLIGWDARV